jgi:hypothetical protein
LVYHIYYKKNENLLLIYNFPHLIQKMTQECFVIECGARPANILKDWCGITNVPFPKPLQEMRNTCWLNVVVTALAILGIKLSDKQARLFLERLYHRNGSIGSPCDVMSEMLEIPVNFYETSSLKPNPNLMRNEYLPNRPNVLFRNRHGHYNLVLPIDFRKHSVNTHLPSRFSQEPVLWNIPNGKPSTQNLEAQKLADDENAQCFSDARLAQKLADDENARLAQRLADSKFAQCFADSKFAQCFADDENAQCFADARLAQKLADDENARLAQRLADVRLAQKLADDENARLAQRLADDEKNEIDKEFARCFGLN